MVCGEVGLSGDFGVKLRPLCRLPDARLGTKLSGPVMSLRRENRTAYNARSRVVFRQLSNGLCLTRTAAITDLMTAAVLMFDDGAATEAGSREYATHYLRTNHNAPALSSTQLANLSREAWIVVAIARASGVANAGISSARMALA
jgi:hypothetical protein